MTDDNSPSVSSPVLGPAPGAGLALSVVCFDWPWPADYGGVIDVAGKVEALLSDGVDVDLHVVSYPRAVEAEPPARPPGRLRVFRYARRGRRALLSRRPFIVASRAVAPLLPNLASGPPVILFEGTHCAGYLGHPRLDHQAQWLRLHNREADYYGGLYAGATSWRQRWYFGREARLLRGYERRAIRMADLTLPITRRDAGYVAEEAGERVLVQTPYTLADRDATARSEPEADAQPAYALFHAGFHVADNVRVALGLAERFASLGLPLVLAGRTPPPVLAEAVADLAGVTLVADPDRREMQRLLAGAQVVVLRSAERAGFKLKLLESLRTARLVLADEAVCYGAPGLTDAARAAGLLRTVEQADRWDEAIRAAFAKTGPAIPPGRRAELLRPYRASTLARTLIEKLRAATFKTN